MAEDSKKSNVNIQYNVAASGLNLENSQNNIKKGSLSYALNAAVENFGSNSINYQNEQGNELCFTFPTGYVLVGKHFIPEQSKILFFITDPEKGKSEIGYMVDSDCKYRRLVNDDCLNFDVQTPILKVVHKITNFGTEIYWPDNNGRRYLDIDNIPYLPKDADQQNPSTCDILYTTKLDCNKLLLQPNVNIPFVDINNVLSGGELTTGTYQFTVQYADAVGNPYTAFYGVTNPTPIADVNIATANFDTPVGKSIVVDINNLDPLGQYQHFNLAVVATVNNISTPYLVGTYFIDSSTRQITYTGQNQTEIQLSMNDIFEKFAYYDKADYVTAVQDVLVWKGVTAVPRLNYQKLANKIKLQWLSYRIPASESYADEINANKLRGYLRDEVYAFDIVWLLDNGKETDAFHIPGREKGYHETSASPVSTGSKDYVGSIEDPNLTVPYWQVYNTASVWSDFPQYEDDDPNYKGPYQYGDFAYWESTEDYPCDPDIWGDLSGKKIRHHKMPDVLVSSITESSAPANQSALVTEDVAVYPLGVKIDSEQILNIIHNSELTQAQKDQIIGYKITRADRGVNKSIVAKGMLRNVGTYEREGQKFYYPNYPYNDLNDDPFLGEENNAWHQECQPFEIKVYQLTSIHPETQRPCMEVEYIGCDDNKRKSIYYYEEDKIDWVGYQGISPDTGAIEEPGQILCSLSKPVILSEGVKNDIAYPSMPENVGGSLPYFPHYEVYYKEKNIGVVGYAEYDTWLLWTKEALCVIYAGWDDPVFGIMTDEGDIGNAGHIGTGSDAEGGYTLARLRKSDPPQTPFFFKEGCDDLFYKVKSHTIPNSCVKDELLKPFPDDTKQRQIFNSPETSYGQPFLGNILKLESVMYGAGKAHFVKVKDNAKYKLITKEAQLDALKSAVEVGDITQQFGIASMFSVYQSYITIYVNGITKKNYAYSFNSRASYNYTSSIPNDGNKQRKLDIKRYLIPQVLSVGDTSSEDSFEAAPGEEVEVKDVNINNFQRETSVFLKTNSTVPFPHNTEQMETTGVTEKSRFLISDDDKCYSPELERDISVVSYYGSLKNEFINQYGQINSYESVDTGFVKLFNNLELNEDIIFGGDTFIGRHAYKTKLPFFIDHRVNAPDDSDVFYDEIGNIAYPKYWHSSRSILESYTNEALAAPLLNFVAYKAHNFDCPNDQGPQPWPDDYRLRREDIPGRTYYDGAFYMFAYGVPSFYCESSYNLDLRTAFNNKEGDFWPHVSTGIPDEWVQETNVSIQNDNTYNYNVTFSKQNKESVITKLPADWGDSEDRTRYPFRAVYSDKQATDADNRVNNWLTYRPVSYFDFPQNYGELVALDSLQNSAILARFENKSLLYNKLLTIDTSNPQAAYIGNQNLFASSPPVDLGDTDQGWAGTQNKFLLKTPYGAISSDAKRGQIFLVNGSKAEDLTKYGSGMSRWFIAHLPFEILKHFPEMDTDNHFNGFGLHGVYDSNYERIIITKLDYIPKTDAGNITYEDNKWWVDLPPSGPPQVDKQAQVLPPVPKKEIFLHDSTYFCNVSWTISFCFTTKSWISFHSYIPNFYIGESNFFYSGLNTKNSNSTIWTHLKNSLIYNTFYGTTEPYIIEYPFSYKYEDEILRNVKSYTKTYKYLDNGDGVLSDFSKYETDDVWFNKAIVYNGQQSSGVLNLFPKPHGNLQLRMAYPIYNSDSKDIIYTKDDNFYQYNTFWSVTKDNKVPQFIRTCESLSIDKEINQDNMDYSLRSHKKSTIRAKDLKVRHILDNRSDVHLVSQFVIAPTQKSN